jgi:hypothetical protein
MHLLVFCSPNEITHSWVTWKYVVFLIKYIPVDTVETHVETPISAKHALLDQVG